VRFDDGTERITSASAAKSLRLEPGMGLSLSRLESSLAELEPGLARERALRLLGYRERSATELAGRLNDEGFPGSVVSPLIESLQRTGLLDDARFAEHLIHTRTAAGYGRRRILRELVQSGIPRDEAEAFIDTGDAGTTEAARLRALVAASPPRDARERDKLIRRLAAKGFAPGAILDAIRCPDETDEPPEDGPLP
jgi:regulatory protein